MALTKMQKAFARGRAEGKTLVQAYEDAGYGPNTSIQSKSVNACRLGKNIEVQAEIKRLQEQAEQGAILKREQRQALLTEFALNENNDMPDRLRSLDQLNRMSGDYTDTVRTQVSGKVEMTFEEKLALIKQNMDETS